MFRLNKIVTNLFLVILCSGALSAGVLAAAGSNVIDKSVIAERGIGNCEAKQQGQALVDCIAGVMGTFATGVNRGEAPSKAPQILTMTREAAGIRGKPKAEALQVLNRLVTVARGLATKNAGDFGPAYNAVGRVFAKAISAIERKG